MKKAIFIKERYCSYKLSKLLQEKGFNQECHARYASERCIGKYYSIYRQCMVYWTKNPGELILPPSTNYESYEIQGDTIPAPTHQMVLDWLRIVHKIHIGITSSYTEDDRFQYKISYTPNPMNDVTSNPDTFSEYSNAVDEACIYALELLVREPTDSNPNNA